MNALFCEAKNLNSLHVWSVAQVYGGVRSRGDTTPVCECSEENAVLNDNKLHRHESLVESLWKMRLSL